jgi:hypothetical protein
MKRNSKILYLMLLGILCFWCVGCGSKEQLNNSYDNASHASGDAVGHVTAAASADGLTVDDSSEETVSGEALDENASGEAAQSKSSKKTSSSTSKKSVSSSTSKSTKNKHRQTVKQKTTNADVSSTEQAATATTQSANPYIEESDGTDTSQDAYQTEPVPQGEQLPVEPQDVTVNTEVANTCSLTVECKTVLSNMDKLAANKKSIVPSDGIIYQNDTAVFYEGESVFDVLKRELTDNRISFEFTGTPLYNSAYIEGIGNLYEMDCGARSGWIFQVNGWSPNYGCSRYVVNNQDKIVWRYTCNMGKDLD